MKTRFSRIVSIFGLFLATAWTQTTSTSVLGTIVDSSGAAVSGAKVTATQTGAGIKREDVSNANGDYNIPFLEVGSYDVRDAGFQGRDAQSSTSPDQ